MLLRPITVDDAEEVFAYASDPIVSQYMIFSTHQTIEDSLAWLRNVPGEFARKERMNFGIVRKSDKKFLGASSFHHISQQHHNLEIGYVLNRAFWGQGYMTEAVREMIRFAFEEMRMHRVAARCQIANGASAKVMERCGMSREATFCEDEVIHGEYVSNHLYAIVNER